MTNMALEALTRFANEHGWRVKRFTRYPSIRTVSVSFILPDPDDSATMTSPLEPDEPGGVSEEEAAEGLGRLFK